MRRHFVRAIPLLALASAAFVAGCGSSTEPRSGITGANLAGTYDMLSIAFQGQPALTPPAANGTLVLTPTNYMLTLVIPPSTEVDSGTYTVNGNTWSQSSTNNQVQSTGTVEFSNDTLTVDVTTVGQQIHTVWKKRS